VWGSTSGDQVALLQLPPYFQMGAFLFAGALLMARAGAARRSRRACNGATLVVGTLILKRRHEWHRGGQSRWAGSGGGPIAVV
jgi:hypothetical protein